MAVRLRKILSASGDRCRWWWLFPAGGEFGGAVRDRSVVGSVAHADGGGGRCLAVEVDEHIHGVGVAHLGTRDHSAGLFVMFGHID